MEGEGGPRLDVARVLGLVGERGDLLLLAGAGALLVLGRAHLLAAVPPVDGVDLVQPPVPLPSVEYQVRGLPTPRHGVALD